MKPKMVLVILLVTLTSCAHRVSYNPEEEAGELREFRENLFEGMSRGELKDLADRDPVLRGMDRDNEILTYQFHTPGESARSRFSYVTVKVDRAGGTVVEWE